MSTLGSSHFDSRVLLTLTAGLPLGVAPSMFMFSNTEESQPTFDEPRDVEPRGDGSRRVHESVRESGGGGLVGGWIALISSLFTTCDCMNVAPLAIEDEVGEPTRRASRRSDNSRVANCTWVGWSGVPWGSVLMQV